MGGTEKLDESGDNTTIDNAFDGGISFFGQNLAEFRSASELLLDIIRKHTRNHLWELLHNLQSANQKARRAPFDSRRHFRRQNHLCLL